jgi:NAD(P)-dependent dehydrogenase (short-subunit alcohol dehydrogenase family)
MRKQRSCCILQISSVGGRLALPGSTPYHAAKWAAGGFTESLAKELAPFGVKVCALEPGEMRTNWGARAQKDVPDLLPDYEPSVAAVVKALHGLWGQRIATQPRLPKSSFADQRASVYLLIYHAARRIPGQPQFAVAGGKAFRVDETDWRLKRLPVSRKRMNLVTPIPNLTTEGKEDTVSPSAKWRSSRAGTGPFSPG